MPEQVAVIRKYKITNKLLAVIQFLFCLSAMVDPTNLFGTKLPLFALLIIVLTAGHHRIDSEIILKYFILLTVQCVSCCMLVFANEIIDYAFTVQNVFFFMTFLLFSWSKDLDIDKAMVYSSVIISSITIFGFVTMYINPEMEAILFAFGTDESIEKCPWMMARREFLGIELVQFFYRSSPAMIIPYTVLVNKLLYARSNKLGILFVISLMFISFVASAQRMIIGSAVLIPIILGFKKFKSSLIFRTIIAIMGLFAFIILIKAIFDTTVEESSDVKFGHIISYVDYYFSYIPYCLFGTGPGALFYTKGYNDIVCQTEWVYLDIFKMYGIIGGSIIMSFFLYPLKCFYKHRKENQSKSLLIGYALFLILSMQNPFLLASTGLIAMYYAYSHIKKPVLLK